MATVGGTNPTLADVLARTQPDGGVETNLAEVNMQVNEELLTDMTFIEGNLPTGHQHTIRTGYPSATWRKFNYGVAQTKSRTQQVTDSCGMLEARSEIDEELAELNGNAQAWRFSEDKAHIIGMNEQLATAVMYSSTKTDPEKIHGLAPRFSALTGAATSDQILNAGGTGSDNTSIWLVGWGPEGVFGVYPKGTKAGLEVNDKGKEPVKDADSNTYYAYVTQYKWKIGLAVKDWGYVVRIANIDYSDLVKTAATGADLVDLMVQASELIKDKTNVRPAFYCSRGIRTWLRRQILNKSNVNLTFDNVEGKRILAFDEIPVRRLDAILHTESALS